MRGTNFLFTTEVGIFSEFKENIRICCCKVFVGTLRSNIGDWNHPEKDKLLGDSSNSVHK